MVEFVIMLTIFMTMISGMLYFFRLHLYQFWADQESRYLGFEQTWVPKAYYEATGVDAETAIQGEAVDFSRPKIIGDLGVVRDRQPFGSMSDLIPGVLSKNDTIIEDIEVGGLVKTAYASQPVGPDDDSTPRLKKSNDVPPSILPKLDQVLETRLRKGGFGGKFCDALVSTSEKYGVRTRINSLFGKNCSRKVENQLSHYIAVRADIPSIMHEMEGLVDHGVDIPNAVQQITTGIVAEGFYSFFYDEVNSRYGDAQGEIISHRTSTAISAADITISRMITDLRYIGSAAAIAAIIGEQAAISARSIGNRDSDAEKSFEDGVNTILHIDASDILPVVGNGYFLNPTYLPVPPIFGPLAPGLFSGTMRTALSLDAGDVGEMINESVKKVTVTYDSANGLFSGATRRFRTGAKLESTFVIDTDPWHIHRRENGTGAYRDIGGEFDQVSESTEEGQLRRRVNGMWLFPTPPDAFFDPILSFVGLDALTSLVDAFRPFGTFLGEIKSFLTNNPLVDLTNTLSQIPVIGSIIPRFPVWPVARPDAYPGSVEMKDDRKMGNSREFKDYVDEQRDFNPPPDPEFN